jgi:hypothetical protein
VRWEKADEMTGREELMNQYQCCFCGKVIKSFSPDACSLIFITGYESKINKNHEQQLWCHALCFKDRLHSSVPLYALDLAKDKSNETDKIKQERKEAKQKYGKAYQRLSEILFAEDPAGINFETNTDEYEPEAGSILPRLHNCKSLDDVNRVVHEEFIKWFDGTAAFSEKYQNVAKRIWEEVIPELEG